MQRFSPLSFSSIGAGTSLLISNHGKRGVWIVGPAVAGCTPNLLNTTFQPKGFYDLIHRALIVSPAALSCGCKHSQWPQTVQAPGWNYSTAVLPVGQGQTATTFSNSQPQLNVKGTHNTTPREERKLVHDFFRHAQHNDFDRAQQFFTAYAERGGTPRLSMYNALISMYARRREFEQAFEMANKLQRTKLQPDAYTYKALLNACSKAEHPPYDLAAEFVDKATDLVQQMQTSGIPLDLQTYNLLMDCQAKAGQVDVAFATFERILKQGVRPDAYTFNILVHACGRAGQPQRALDVVQQLLPKAKLAPDLITWNTLLGAFAAAKDIDGAYRVWQEMQAAAMAPDRVTEYHLASAFAGNPAMATEVILEARAFAHRLTQELAERTQDASKPSAVLSAGDAKPVAPSSRPQRPTTQMPQQYKQRPIDLKTRTSDPWFLDLHGLSTSATRVAVLRRLQHLTQLASAPNRRTAAFYSPPSDSFVVHNLVIVTGLGKHSRRKQGMLRQTVVDVLEATHLQFTEDPGSPGRLCVPQKQLQTWLAKQRGSNAWSTFLHKMGMRYTLVLGGLSSVVAVVLVVPRILAHS